MGQITFCTGIRNGMDLRTNHDESISENRRLKEVFFQFSTRVIRSPRRRSGWRKPVKHDLERLANWNILVSNRRLAQPEPDMFTRYRFLIIYFVMLLGSWPAMLHAEQSEQQQQALESSSFLLVATNQMPDPRFRKTVLVVTRHGHTGPIGVIINRPQDIKLGKIFPDYPAAKEMRLFYGGPAYIKQVCYLVRGGETVSGSLTISSNVYLAYDLSALDELLSGKRSYEDLRVMHGLASWAPGQLEYEIKIGSWYVMPLDEKIIFDLSPAEMWQELFNRANSIIL